MDQLERDGLVRRMPGTLDRRSVRAELTESGRRLVGAFRREFMAHSLQLVEDMPREDLERVHDVVVALAQRIDSRLSRPVSPRTREDRVRRSR